ncbi:MAG TPA: CopG family ribbon-helix-helix protein [Nitrososphaera sp.]
MAKTRYSNQSINLTSDPSRGIVLTKRPNTFREHNANNNNAKRISMSLPPELLIEFDKSIKKAGFSDRSKAIQTALHAFIDQNDWKEGDDRRIGAGAIMMLYDNHIYSHDGVGIDIQHRHSNIISSTTHLHLDHNNCLETIMVRGEIKRIRMLMKGLHESRGIKSLKVYFITVV